MSTQAEYEAERKKVQTIQDKAAKTAADAKKEADKKKKIGSLNNDIAQLKSALIRIAAQLKIYETNLSKAQKIYIAYAKEIYANGHTPTDAQLEQLASLDNDVQGAKGQVTAQTTQQTKVQKDLDTKLTQLNALVPPLYGSQVKITSAEIAARKRSKKSKTDNSGGTTDTNVPPKKPIGFISNYKYNAPMISSSYFNLNSLQARELQQNGYFVDAGNYGDARAAWSGQGGRGTIQMDKLFLANYDTSANAKDTVGQFDPQLYGFKFLYNPTTVGMAWGSMAAMSPDYEASGQDVFNPIMSGLASSTVAFTLMLNRIEDITLLKQQSNGPALSDVQAEFRRTQILAANEKVKSSYGPSVDSADLAELYKRGTMYDLEYLFKTINGPNATFQSSLNGLTADKGWIRPQIVELHLGESLRYRVRITDLSVNHAVFDSRMVPVLSTVNITFARFPDFSGTQLPTAGGATH
jgi:hypothetical protein